MVWNNCEGVERDEHGNKITEFYFIEGTLAHRGEYHYDKEGRLAYQVATHSNTGEYPSLHPLYYRYDSNGFLVKEEEPTGVIVPGLASKTYLYPRIDKYGNWIEQKCYDWKGNVVYTVNRKITYSK